MIYIEYRVENKYIVSDVEMAAISKRLKMVMSSDIHQTNDSYEVRSLYFDDIFGSCMEENDAGIDCRKKYRIRTYGAYSSQINLEIKEKCHGLTKKRACAISRAEYDGIIHNGVSTGFKENPVYNEWLLRMRCTDIRPQIIVVYERTAFVHPVGNVRITFDRNIMASRKLNSFFDEHVSGLVPVMPIGMHVLEVKYDELIPDTIAKQLETGKLRQTAFSKYCLGRQVIKDTLY